MATREEPSPELVRRVETLTGRSALRCQRVQGGYTPAERWVVHFADGDSAFAKVATTKLTASFLRDEQRLYAALQAPFMPRYLGWDESGEYPLLLLEDLSRAFWPPPWNGERIEAVLESIRQMHATPASVPPFHQVHGPWSGGWSAVAADPEPFLSLGLGSRAWLESALPALVEAERTVDTSGSALTHFDIRSDNICLLEGRALLVDWNCACLGNPALDLGGWLPSLRAEGGPPPESLLPDAAPIAAWMSGFFAARAGLPQIPDAPRVRWIQRVQLETALPWAVQALELSPP